MSEPGRDSIPTSANKRSNRPVKKARLNNSQNPATVAQSAALDALFSHPDREIHIPTAATSSSIKPMSAPPEIVANVQGSSAGAGSGEFHVYKASRRREYERMRGMEEEKTREEADRIFEEKREELRRRDEERRLKNRAKRRGKGKSKEKEADGGKVDGLKKLDLTAGRIVPEDRDENGETPNGVATVEEVGIVIHDED